MSVHLLTNPAVPGTPIRLKPASTMPKLVNGIRRRQTIESLKRWAQGARLRPRQPQDHAANQKENRALGDTVIDQMHDRRRQAGDGVKRQTKRDVANLAHTGIGKQAFQIVLEDGNEVGSKHRQQ
jgi:hypothetical protein